MELSSRTMKLFLLSIFLLQVFYAVSIVSVERFDARLLKTRNTVSGYF